MSMGENPETKKENREDKDSSRWQKGNEGSSAVAFKLEWLWRLFADERQVGKARV